MREILTQPLLDNPWMTPAETEWLILRARRARMFAEVGVWKGITTANIARHAPKTLVWAIDHFEGSSEHLDPKSKHFEPKLAEPDWLLNEFCANTAGLKNVCLLRLPSVAAANRFRDEYFDMVFLDASHDYPQALEDMRAWLPLVAPGGMLCGHDGPSPGVLKALGEFTADVPGEVWGVADSSIWYYLKGG